MVGRAGPPRNGRGRVQMGARELDDRAGPPMPGAMPIAGTLLAMHVLALFAAPAQAWQPPSPGPTGGARSTGWQAPPMR
jgi:hypothetical protein